MEIVFANLTGLHGILVPTQQPESESTVAATHSNMRMHSFHNVLYETLQSAVETLS